MIGNLDIQINAQFPNMPLKPVFSFRGSPSSFRVVNWPEKIGDWEITKIYVQAEYPDNTIKSAECQRTGGFYVGTLDGCAVPGSTKQGFTVFADGTDENGGPVTGYILGKADLFIIDSDPVLEPGAESWQVRYFETPLSAPRAGDCAIDGDFFKIFDGLAWHEFGGAQISAVSQLSNDAGYQTAPQVSSIVTGYGYQTAPQVQAAINNAGFLTSLNYGLNEVIYPDNALVDNTVNHCFIPAVKDNQNRIWHHEFIEDANAEAEQDYSFLCQNNALYCCYDSNGSCWELYEWTYDDEQGVYSWYCIQTVEGLTSDTTVVFDEWQITLTVSSSYSNNFVFPDPQTGKARDFLLYLESDVDELSIYFPQRDLDDEPFVYLSEDDEIFSFESGKTIVAFSEISPRTFLVNKQKLNVVTQSQGE